MGLICSLSPHSSCFHLPGFDNFLGLMERAGICSSSGRFDGHPGRPRVGVDHLPGRDGSVSRRSPAIDHCQYRRRHMLLPGGASRCPSTLARLLGRSRNHRIDRPGRNYRFRVSSFHMVAFTPNTLTRHNNTVRYNQASKPASSTTSATPAAPCDRRSIRWTGPRSSAEAPNSTPYPAPRRSRRHALVQGSASWRLRNAPTPWGVGEHLPTALIREGTLLQHYARPGAAGCAGPRAPGLHGYKSLICDTIH
jgi:hypothetical protein